LPSCSQRRHSSPASLLKLRLIESATSRPSFRERPGLSRGLRNEVANLYRFSAILTLRLTFNEFLQRNVQRHAQLSFALRHPALLRMYRHAWIIGAVHGRTTHPSLTER
jgi:hypothetical protein